MSHYHPDGLYAALARAKAANKQAELAYEAACWAQAEGRKHKPIVKKIVKKKEDIVTPRLDNVTVEKAAKYPVAQRAFLANRRPSQQALPDLSITQETEETEETEEDLTPPMLVRAKSIRPSSPVRRQPAKK